VVSTLSGVGPVGDVPVPVTVIVCGLSAAVSMIVNCAVRVPVAVGVSSNERTHDVPAGTNRPRHGAPALPKSGAAGPLWWIPLMKSEAFPVLVNVIERVTLVVPTCWAPKMIVVELNDATGVVVGGGVVCPPPTPPPPPPPLPPPPPPWDARAVPADRQDRGEYRDERCEPNANHCVSL
jgi:hypothetical protein